jgi:serine/threonine protein kinase
VRNYSLSLSLFFPRATLFLTNGIFFHEQQKKKKNSRIKFPFIVRVLGWSNLGGDATGDLIGVVMDLCSIDLREGLAKGKNNYSLAQKTKWSRQIGSALQYLHVQVPRITHGDIHPSNVLFSSLPLKYNDSGGECTANALLCDFDLSSIQGNKSSQLSKLSLFAQLLHSSSHGTIEKNDIPVATDWLLFGFLLFSVRAVFVFLLQLLTTSPADVELLGLAFHSGSVGRRESLQTA